MQIMQELSKNKPSFSFKYTEEINQTTHVAPYGPIVFNDNISFYFNSLSSVQDVLKESCHGNITAISTQFKEWSVQEFKSHTKRYDDMGSTSSYDNPLFTAHTMRKGFKPEEKHQGQDQTA